MSPARRPRIVLAAAALAAATLVLAGCGGQEAGAAATLGDSRISEQELGAEVRAVLSATGQPVTSSDQALTSQTLGRMITLQLVDLLAEREGVVVTQGQIDGALAQYVAQAGDQAAVEQLFLEQGIAPSQIIPIVTLNLQAQALGSALLPDGSEEEQGQAVFDAVKALSEELETAVSPRFGTWDANSLSLGPTPDDLSMPPALG